MDELTTPAAAVPAGAGFDEVPTSAALMIIILLPDEPVCIPEDTETPERTADRHAVSRSARIFPKRLRQKKQHT